jgi:hypothetical protein
MNDTVNPSTGEVMNTMAEKTVIAMMSPQELVDYEPVSPPEVEQMIQILSERVVSAPGVIVDLYEKVHRADEVYEGNFADQMVAAADKGHNPTFARAIAKSRTKDELHQLNVAKEALRYAEELQKGLTSKLYGYLNLNKGMIAAYNASGARS